MTMTLLKDIMSKQADYLAPNASLQSASTQMQKGDMGFLPIKENGILIGVVTDRDITIRGVAKGLDPNATIDKVMTKKVVSMLETDSIAMAAILMQEKQIRRLVILDKNKGIVGIVSLSDIATKYNDIDLCGKIICTVSEKTR